MRKIPLVLCSLAVLVCLFIMIFLPGRASDFTQAQVSGTVNATLLSATANTTGNATYVEIAKYHTFQITCTSTLSTNVVVVLNRSLNSTHWIPFYTNTISGPATNDTTLVGHWAYVQAVVSGISNSAAVTVLYLGGN